MYPRKLLVDVDVDVDVDVRCPVLVPFFRDPQTGPCGGPLRPEASFVR